MGRDRRAGQHHGRVVNDTVAPALKLTKAPKDNAKLTKNATLAAAASDRNGVAKVQLLVNGKVVATDTKAGYSFMLNPMKYGKKFTVKLRAYDKAGNVKTFGKRTCRRCLSAVTGGTGSAAWPR